MNKLILISLVTLILPACRRTQKAVSPDPWADYRKGYAFWRSNKDSAFFYFNRAAVGQPDKKQSALAYYSMSLIQSDEGDHYGAQESLTQSLKLLDVRKAKDRYSVALDYDGLGMTCYDLIDYAQALSYYQQALSYADDKSLQALILNNIGNACKGLKAYDRALKYYQQAIRLTGTTNDNYARTLTNIAITKWKRNPRYNPGPELRKSLAFRLRFNDKLGENSSYAHLADFYMDNMPDSALYYAKKMFTVASSLQSPDDELEALQKLIVLSQPAEVKTYFRRYQTLSDSLGKSRNAAKNQFALIRYNVEKSKAENLALQQENAAKKYQLGGVLIVVALGSILAVLWYRKRKQRLQLEAENRIRKNRLQLSQKVHDVVANGLYRVISGIENEDKIDKDDILDQIEILYEQSRDISYEQPEAAVRDFHGKIARLLTGFGSPATKIAVAGNNLEIWEKVGAHARHELEQVLQELMVNMKKHSQATSVAVRFGHQAHDFHIDYVDNGIGFDANTHYGNGLTNTGNRIEQLNGTITFDTQPGKGTKIHIAVRLNN
ncbi:MAG TPA: ATP-binding protein [Mucilaginibacter sp.]|nr:ATP-binding protein [Mucilaginibacter sp.]